MNKSLIEEIHTILEGPNDKITIDVDFLFVDNWESLLKKYKISYKTMSILLTGKKKDLLNLLRSKGYDMDEVDIKDNYPELYK